MKEIARTTHNYTSVSTVWSISSQIVVQIYLQSTIVYSVESRSLYQTKIH